MACPIITLTSDFGLGSTFVGQMKGRILDVCAEARLVDLTHAVPPQSVEVGAYQLEIAYSVFPAGTIHLAIVDPGVGSPRRALIVRTADYLFLAPDNGLLTRVLRREQFESAIAIDPEHPTFGSVSPTFHGRDVFAPVAAALACGEEPAAFGSEVDTIEWLDGVLPTPIRGETISVRVLHIDRFGNATVDLTRAGLAPLLEGNEEGIRLQAPDGEAVGLVRTYSEAAEAGPFLLFNSANYLEAALFRGNAAESLGLEVGSEVDVVLP
jgi:S-adenosylmethionine hydrolase